MKYLDIIAEMERNRKLNELSSLPFVSDKKICWFNYRVKEGDNPEVLKISISDIYCIANEQICSKNYSKVFDYKIVEENIGDDEDYFDYFESVIFDEYNNGCVDYNAMWEKANEVLPKNFILIYKEIEKFIKEN